MERTLLHTDNAYFLPHVDFRGRCASRTCRRTPPSAASAARRRWPRSRTSSSRSPSTSGIDAFDVRLRNLYGIGERNVTPYGQIVDKNHLPEIFATLAATLAVPQAPRRDRPLQRRARPPRTSAASR